MLTKALKGHNQWWRYLLNLITLFLSIQLASGFVIIALFILKGKEFANFSRELQVLLSEFSTNENFIFLLTPFILGFFIFFGLTKLFHNKSFTDVTTSAKTFRWNHFTLGFLAWLSISGMFWLAFYLTYPQHLQFNYQGSQFWSLIIISFLFLPFQTGLEEVLFRGYLYQGIGIITKNKWASVFINAALFALLHYMNPEVAAYGFWEAMSQYFLFGLIFGSITLLSNGIEMAWGAHAANNIFLSIFITNSSSVLQTPALFIQTEVVTSFDIISLIFGGGLFILALWKLQHKLQ